MYFTLPQDFVQLETHFTFSDKNIIAFDCNNHYILLQRYSMEEEEDLEDVADEKVASNRSETLYKAKIPSFLHKIRTWSPGQMIPLTLCSYLADSAMSGPPPP